MESYFSKFPLIYYNNTLTRNITERVSIIKGQKRIPTNYYPYELIDGLRSDVLANSYYKDPNLDWMIYLANGITDPYYDWYMGTDEFNAYIETKYGDIPSAQSNILYYRNNWYNDPIAMTVSSYVAQTPAIQKFYEPNFGPQNSVINYARREQDWTASTNQIVAVTTSSITNTFTIGEKVDIRDPFNVVGGGSVISSPNSSNNVLILQHITGNNSVSGYTATGRTSNAVATISYSTVKQYVIPLSEQAYYEPVTSFDVENDKNEQQKFIYLLNSASVLPAAESIRKQLQNNAQ